MIYANSCLSERFRKPGVMVPKLMGGKGTSFTSREKLEKSSFSFLLPDCQACSFSCPTATVDLRRHSVPTSKPPYCGVALLTINLCFERFLCSYNILVSNYTLADAIVNCKCKVFNDLGTVFPMLAAQWDYEKNWPKTPQDVFPRDGRGLTPFLNPILRTHPSSSPAASQQAWKTPDTSSR